MRVFRMTVSGILAFSFIMLSGLFPLKAQDKFIQRSSEDSLECLKLFSVYAMALQKNMHDYAIGPWRTMYENCPDISPRVYSDGVDLMTHYIDLEKDSKKREAWVDTLLMIYDRRIIYFGHHEKYPEGWILGRKGLEIVKYRRDRPDALQEAYGCFERSCNLLGEQSEPAVLLAWMHTTRSLFSQELIAPDNVFENFIRIHSLVNDQLARESQASRKVTYDKILSAVETIFANTGLSDCSIFADYLGETKVLSNLNSEEVKRQIRLLQVIGCMDSELYLSLIEQDYKIAPDAEAAGRLARMFLQEKNFEKARKYYLEAIEISEADSITALFCYELGVLTHGHFGQVEKARAYARQAVSLNPAWGAPYMLLGSIYAHKASELIGNDFEKHAVYWVAVDQFLMALKVDSDFLDEARKQIAVYSQYFPDQQNCFFHGLEEGQLFTVGDWINESTTVRYRK